MKFRLVEENELERRAKYHKKKQKGMSPFYSPDGGNVPLAIDRFNNSVADGANGLCESSLNESNYEGSYGFVSSNAYEKIKQLSNKLTNLLGKYDEVIDSIESNAKTDKDWNILETDPTYRTLIKTYQDNYEVINLLSDMIKNDLIHIVDDDSKEDLLIDLGIYTVSDLQNLYNRLEKILADITLSESLKEDTVKNSDGTWSNKGDEGSHGKFRTKKQADNQRKAMFANGYKESLKESANIDDAKLEKELTNIFNQNHLYPEEMYVRNGEIYVYISNGDWKHEHQKCKWLVNEFIGDQGLVTVDYFERDTDDDGSDTYSAEHIWKVSTEDDVDEVDFTKYNFNI